MVDNESVFLAHVLEVARGIVLLPAEDFGGGNSVVVGRSGAGELSVPVGARLALFIGGYGTDVFLAAAVVGAAPGPGETHLQKLTRHVCPHKVLGLQTRPEQAPNGQRRGPAVVTSLKRQQGRTSPL